MLKFNTWGVRWGKLFSFLLIGLLIIGLVLPVIPISAKNIDNNEEITILEDSDKIHVDNGILSIDFNKNSFNIFYDNNGNILVGKENVSLQYLDGSNWKYFGSSSILSVRNYSKYCIITKTTYSPKFDFSYSIDYKITFSEEVKWTLSFHNLVTNKYRVVWDVDNVNTDTVKMEPFGMSFGDNNVYIDYQDVEKSKGSITSKLINNSGELTRGQLFFDIGEIKAGEGYALDPTIGTKTSSQTRPFQQRMFEDANGVLHIIMPSENTAVMEHRWSSDGGATWSQNVTIRAGSTQFAYISVDYIAPYFHYTYASTTNNTALFHRAATINATNEFEFADAEQIAVAAEANVNYTTPIISCSDTGETWIGYASQNDTGYYPFVTYSNNITGGWDTVIDYPILLEHLSSPVWNIIPTRLTNNKMSIISTGTNQEMRSRIWDGVTLSAVELVANSSNVSSARIGTSSILDTVCVVYASSAANITYRERDYSSGWGSETIVAAASATSSPVVSINSQDNFRYILWIESPTVDHVYYARYNGETWGTVVDWIDESIDTLPQSYYINTLQHFNDHTGLLYETGVAAPYTLKFEPLDVTTNPATVTTNTPTSITSVNAVINGTGSANVSNLYGLLTVYGIQVSRNQINTSNVTQSTTITDVSGFTANFNDIGYNDSLYYRGYAVNALGASYGAWETIYVARPIVYSLSDLLPIIFVSSIIIAGVALLATGSSVASIVTFVIAIIIGLAMVGMMNIN